MFSTTRTALAFAAAVLGVASIGCTDLTVEPKSTVTEANVFNDPNSYKAFIARVYSGLAVSGQQGPSGRPDISCLAEGVAGYRRRVFAVSAVVLGGGGAAE